MNILISIYNFIFFIFMTHLFIILVQVDLAFICPTNAVPDLCWIFMILLLLLLLLWIIKGVILEQICGSGQCEEYLDGTRGTHANWMR